MTFPGALHSFDLRALTRTTVAGVGGSFAVGGNGAAASASQTRFLAFFKARLGR